jgi:DnaJ-class molecular chaperone
MVQQMQMSCSACKGSGKLMDEKDKCKTCKGNKVYKDRKVLEVAIEKGMIDGQKIRFSGEADEIPGTVPGDVVIVVQEKQHDTFTRKGADLLVNLELELSESLCGFTKTITHLDGRVIKIDVPGGVVTRHDSYKLVKSEGMPLHGNPFTKGGLFVHFTVKFPKSLPSNVVSKLQSLLPSGPSISLNNDEEECVLSEVDGGSFGKTSATNSNGDDDADEGHGAQNVQCGQN